MRGRCYEVRGRCREGDMKRAGKVLSCEEGAMKVRGR